MHRISRRINSPVYLECRQITHVVGMVVDISPWIAIENIIAALMAFVNAVRGKTGAAECHDIILYPPRPIVLSVIDILFNIARNPIITLIPYVLGIDNISVLPDGHMIRRSPVIAHEIIMHRSRTAVFTSGEFIPRIIRQSVTIRIYGHHYYSRLRASTRFR